MVCNVTTALLVMNKGLCRQGNTNPRAGPCLGAQVKSLTAKTQNGEKKGGIYLCFPSGLQFAVFLKIKLTK